MELILDSEQYQKYNEFLEWLKENEIMKQEAPAGDISGA